VLSEAGERKVSEKLVGEGQFLALRFCRNCRRAYAIKRLAGVLQTEAVRRKLSASREVKMETPAHWTRMKLPSAINAREEGCGKSSSFCHSERSEESLRFNIMKRKRDSSLRSE
jgi:hypothetical protein